MCCGVGWTAAGMDRQRGMDGAHRYRHFRLLQICTKTSPKHVRSRMPGGLGARIRIGFCVQESGKKLAASSMLHEAKVAYYAFDVAARFLILLFMPLLWLR